MLCLAGITAPYQPNGATNTTPTLPLANMPPLVLHKVPLLRKALAAHGARVQPLIGRRSHVVDELRFMNEPFATNVTGVRFLVTVQLLVVYQVRTSGKGFLTQTANVWLFARVQFFVCNQVVVSVGEPFQADTTHKRPLAGVKFFVADQLASVAKALLTYPALVGPLARMRFFVADEAVLTGEALLAGATHVRLATRVRPFVLGQVALLGEALLADAARVGLLPGARSHVHVEITLQLVGLVAKRADEARVATRTRSLVSSLASRDVDRTGRSTDSFQTGFHGCHWKSS